MSTAAEQARAWLAQDPDPVTRSELEELLAAADDGDSAAAADLDDRFAGRLAFGTAGLRGRLGAGSNRMNRVLVAQAAAGFAAYLLERAGDDVPTVVVGYDGRRNSDVFARDSAELFAGAGLRAILLPRLLPTPVLAFAVREFGADAGVMVTASHNPPDDNGYKVYLGGADEGSQIVSPADAEIAAHIQRVADEHDVTRLPRSVGYEVAGESVVDAYVAATAAVAPAPASAEGLSWVYTAMHGVGWETFSRIVDAAGYPAPIPVTAQIDPDGAFPTVAFPNPEEPGAMDLAFEAARDAGADLIIANDPDADRLAVAIPDQAADGGWRRLTGNQIGLLLGWRAAREAAERGEVDGRSLACSLVSSPGLAEIAAHYGLDFRATLTGFKWISRAPGIVFGFEEALGYLVNPATVRDKDGISAAIAMLGMAAEARGRGATVADLLDELGATFGHFASDQISVRVEDVSQISDIMAALRAQHPTSIGDVAVDRVDDLLAGGGDLPSGDVVRIWLTDGSRLIVRPSGTEPKLKLYIDVRGDSSADADARLAATADGARALLDALG
ncbi:phospho-sugar mutase [Microbacterium terricola]|uniref:Phosphomannomutase n=1 Tax=Microbacterium terricola TaxID=344163 RepID=A0ABM8DWN3_9MICO|nr:phospho-sugar mutase [Microbacterium terricola]UYK39272.1 phospho-sugar mutase [Microbacterium terricola]BDV30007.1 putative phosphomannomutase [Microbacterium terricola]